VLLPLTLAIAGCGGRAPADNLEKEKLHLINVYGLAGQYALAHKKPATSIADVKAWAIQEGKASEEDFLSTRDKQPYGLASGMGGAIVFETTGKNGRCYIFQAGAFREVPQAQVAEMAKGNAKAMAGGRGPPGKTKK
jgi:hypothetical protein